MGKLDDPIFGNVEPDDTVELVFNLSQGQDERGPWNEEPDFEYVADPRTRRAAPPAAGQPRRRGSHLGQARIQCTTH